MDSGGGEDEDGDDIQDRDLIISQTATRNKPFTQAADEPLCSHSYATATILENHQSHNLSFRTLNSKSCILICFLAVFSGR